MCRVRGRGIGGVWVYGDSCRRGLECYEVGVECCFVDREDGYVLLQYTRTLSRLGKAC